MKANEIRDYFSIQPPKLEDAGLEDPALPIECIQEAFRRAAELVEAKVDVSVQVRTPLDGAVDNIVGDPLPKPRGEEEESCIQQGTNRTTPDVDAIVNPSEHLKEDLVLLGEEIKSYELGKAK